MCTTCDVIRSEEEKTRRHLDRFAEQLTTDMYLVLIGLTSSEDIPTVREAVSDRALFDKALIDHEVRLRQLERKAKSDEP
jgi:hypothetical protein